MGIVTHTSKTESNILTKVGIRKTKVDHGQIHACVVVQQQFVGKF